MNTQQTQHVGMTREELAWASTEAVSDGTIAMSRAAACGQEILQANVGSETRTAMPQTRGRLLQSAANAPRILRGWAIVPLEDKLLVRYASYREGYVCETCGGLGYSADICPACKGEREKYTESFSACGFCEGEGQFAGHACQRCDGKGGLTVGERRPCPSCRIVGSEGAAQHSCGFLPCASCSGTGLAAGVLAIPDASKQDHSYGDIIAIGPEIHDLAVGDRVLFSRMAGIHIHGDTICCLMRRGEVMAYMKK